MIKMIVRLCIRLVLPAILPLIASALLTKAFGELLTALLRQ